MKEERLLENIGRVKEKFIEEAAPKRMLENNAQEAKNSTSEQKPWKKTYTFVKWGALAACLCIVAGLGVKFALPMFEQVDEFAMYDKDTTSADNIILNDNLTTEKTKASTEVLPNKADADARPEEDVDCNTTTEFTTDQGFPNWGLTLSVENVTPTGLTLVVTQSGGEPTGELQTGEAYRLIALVDETWKTVEELPLPEGVDGRGWNSIAYLLPKEETREFEINWNWIFGELPSGTYRLIKEFMDFRKTADYDTAEYWVEFKIQ